MRVTYENQGTNTYLVYEIGAEDELDSMSLGMLTNNKIPGIAEATFLQVDTTKYIKFNVSAKVSVSQLFSGPVNKKRLVGVFTGIIDAMLSAEEYMLDPNSMLLDLDHIFADVTTCEAVLVCLPVMNMEQKNPELGVFFKNIMFNTQFDQTENCDHVAQIINYLNTNAVLSLTDFKAVLDGITKLKTLEKPKAQPVSPQVEKPRKSPVVIQAQPEAPHVQPQVPVAVPQPKQEPAPVKLDATMLPESLQAIPEEKPMSMFYLLQHYNKENAAKYKAQQASKKDQKADAKKKDGSGKKKKAAPAQSNAGFAVPGQKNDSVDAGFAVPGQANVVNVSVEAKPVQPVVSSKPQPMAKQPQVPVQQPQPAVQTTAQSICFGETTVLGSPMGETTVLGMAASTPAVQKPYLIRAKNNEKIPLNKPVFRIGKEKSYVDYFIGDNTAISRSHANIVNHNGVFFVVDTNSTNHTYVNGTMIQSNVETELTSGSRIRLANEEFEFKLL